MPKGPKPRNGVTMTAAERQAAYRARRQAGIPATKVVVRRPKDRRSRPQQWRDAVQVLVELQSECQEWLDNLPEAGGSEATREALENICALDLSELEDTEPPKGYGRD